MASTSASRVGGRYDLVRRIARGGGGTVWEAHDGMLDRTVAVKQVEIPDELSDTERERLRRRVLAEARAAARLEHPSVVVIHDVLDGEDTVHLVMEYVQAPTLRELVDRSGPLPEDAAAAIGFGLLDVLMATHRRGVVHRDVKPSNVFVVEDGSVKLGDFGIAALTGEVSLTRTGVALGSPSYLAPEQARGESAAPPADLWGLGATLYYAVEGTAPFDRRTALATVHAVVNEPMRPFERADLLREPVTALLDKDPASRPDAARVREQLAAVAGIPASAVAASPSAAPAASEPTAPQAPLSGDDAPDSRAAPARGGRMRWLVLAGLVGIAAVLGMAMLDDPDGDADDPPAAEGPEEPPVEAPGSAAGDGASGDDQGETADETPDEPAAGSTDGGQDDGADEPDETDGGSDEADPPEAEADDAEADDAGSAGDGSYVVPETDAPGDWQTVAGETYEVAVPPGWQRREVAANRTDWVDPSTGTYLRVEWTDTPAADPVRDWERVETNFRGRYPDYDRIRLEPARYRDWDAAMWEYAYATGGSSLRALNLNVLADDLDHAFALNLQAPADDWDRVAALFPAIAGSFRPTVGG